MQRNPNLALRRSPRDAECNGPVRHRRSTALLLAALSILVVACGDDRSEPVAASSTLDDGAPAPGRGISSGPNTATLSWDPVTQPNLRGYRVYYGPAPGAYLQSPGEGINTGNVTTHSINGLASGRRYYFAVTAFDASNNESEFSNEAFKDIP